MPFYSPSLSPPSPCVRATHLTFVGVSYLVFLSSLSYCTFAFLSAVPFAQALDHLHHGAHGKLCGKIIAGAGMAGAAGAVHALAWILFGGPAWVGARVKGQYARQRGVVHSALALALLAFQAALAALEGGLAAGLLYVGATHGLGQRHFVAERASHLSHNVIDLETSERAAAVLDKHWAYLAPLCLVSALVKIAFLKDTIAMIKTTPKSPSNSLVEDSSAQDQTQQMSTVTAMTSETQRPSDQRPQRQNFLRHSIVRPHHRVPLLPDPSAGLSNAGFEPDGFKPDSPNDGDGDSIPDKVFSESEDDDEEENEAEGAFWVQPLSLLKKKKKY